jgi:predicted  nucleic acid-binding Zn-ribbon protein
LRADAAAAIWVNCWLTWNPKRGRGKVARRLPRRREARFFMIEPIMFVGLGFLAASLLALVIIPLVHARAIRLTKRRLEASIPVSVTEIQADKDQLRAEFAMSTRRLEMSVDQLRAKSTAQLAELGKKTEALNALQAELAEKTAAFDTLDTRDQTLLEKLKTAEAELGTRTEALREAERKLADTVAELDKVRTDLAERSVTYESQRIEAVTFQTQVATLKDRVADFEQQVQQTEATLMRERTDAERVRDERMRLQRDFSAYKQETEAENVTMRERINDVAAQVAHLAIALEGPGSPIETILAADAIGRPTNGAGAAAGEAAPADKASLADRIRALQSRASRMAGADAK